eukprot:TRINITY_DN14840_c0_g1_i1.p1 TRINITY_DN14840_c0_g1~~TRINITY_DN14840_c0_g1_i1.p1  ORF type:complete len:320 (+),score=71.30 TRINITY_DN14840_c0_g1_i1:82-960(+)
MQDNPKYISGNAIAKIVREELKLQIEKLVSSGNKPPGLGAILVGQRTDSATYVRMKERACKEIGMRIEIKRFPEETSEAQILDTVYQFNEDKTIHGILVQLPLPPHMDVTKILDAVSYDKDVDGFHTVNVGLLAMRGRTPKFVPCTPKGCLELLKRSNVEIKGKNAVVLGRSNTVGIPMSLLLLEENATVTICHSNTVDIPSFTRNADILVAAIGQAEMVKKEWIKPGATVIDVGINTDPSGNGKLVGDVARDAVEVAGKITPVPGGVGPMTVAMLLKNTVDSALSLYGIDN